MRTTAPIGPVLASAGVLLNGINSDDFRNVVSNFNGDDDLRVDTFPGGNTAIFSNNSSTGNVSKDDNTHHTPSLGGGANTGFGIGAVTITSSRVRERRSQPTANQGITLAVGDAD